jgi:transcriptional regulator of met regulon
MYQEKSQMVLDCNSAGLTLILFPSAGLVRKRHELLLLQKLQNLFEMTEANHASQLVTFRVFELLCCAFLLSFTRQTLLSLAQRSKSAQENDKIDER